MNINELETHQKGLQPLWRHQEWDGPSLTHPTFVNFLSYASLGNWPQDGWQLTAPCRRWVAKREGRVGLCFLNAPLALLGVFSSLSPWSPEKKEGRRWTGGDSPAQPHPLHGPPRKGCHKCFTWRSQKGLGIKGCSTLWLSQYSVLFPIHFC